MRMRTAVVAAATVAAVSLSGLVAAPAVATGPVDKQHGAADGHLPATRSGVDVVGKAPILDRSAGRVSDVTVSGNYAYLGAWQGEGGCQTGGVYIFDIADPTAPRQVGFVPTGAGSFVGEGVQVVSLLQRRRAAVQQRDLRGTRHDRRGHHGRRHQPHRAGGAGGGLR